MSDKGSSGVHGKVHYVTSVSHGDILHNERADWQMRDSDAQCQVPDTRCQLGSGTNLPWRRTNSAYGETRVLLFIPDGRTSALCLVH